MGDLKIGIKLKENIKIEQELIAELEKVGKRTGLPKQWLLRGFKQAMLEEQGYITTTSKPTEKTPETEVLNNNSVANKFKNYMVDSKAEE